MRIALDETTVLDDGDLVLALGVKSATLARARRGGRLRYMRAGSRILYTGAWVREWLQVEEEARRAAEARLPKENGSA